MITIELAAEVEARLAAQAAEQGIPLEQYLRQLLEEQVPERDRNSLSSKQRADLWRRSTADLPRTTPLSDEAISRKTIYDSRG
jgi:hypothetical protein